jgi:hypothetical protein
VATNGIGLELDEATPVSEVASVECATMKFVAIEDNPQTDLACFLLLRSARLANNSWLWLGKIQQRYIRVLLHSFEDNFTTVC